MKGNRKPYRSGFRLLPATGLGWWAVGLLTAFVLLFLVRFGPLKLAFGFRGGQGFFDNPWMGLTALAAGLSGALAGIAAALAVARCGERSILVFLILLVGLFVAAFSLGELFGHG
jgi:hypothetical protein